MVLKPPQVGCGIGAGEGASCGCGFPPARQEFHAGESCKAERWMDGEFEDGGEGDLFAVPRDAERAVAADGLDGAHAQPVPAGRVESWKGWYWRR